VKVFFVKYNFLSIIYNYNFLIDWKQRVRIRNKFELIIINNYDVSNLLTIASKSYVCNQCNK
jgi:hypothetical protein